MKKDKMHKLAPGYYEGNYKGKYFTLIKIEGQNQWYWRSENNGGDDWYSCKKLALLGVKEFIDGQFPILKELLKNK